MYFISPNIDGISNRCYVITVNTTSALDIILVRPEHGPNGTETCCLE
jgi:hypothetical protein